MLISPIWARVLCVTWVARDLAWPETSCSSWKLVPALANLGGPDFDSAALYALCARLCVSAPLVA